MAKGLRASSRKKNAQALRARLYGPASDARAERLSAKLQELAAKPRPDQERAMDVDEQDTKPESTSPDSKDEGQFEDVAHLKNADSGHRNGR
jgi:hypothetical protein